jgi:hypothetical protein
VDIRRLLFDECAKRNWYILMITPLGMSLEDIFLTLVAQNDAQRALAGKKEEKKEEAGKKEEINEEKEGENGDGNN